MLSISRKIYISCGWDTSQWRGGGNFTLETYINGPVNAKSGLVVNLTDLDKVLKEVTALFDHKHLQKDFPELRIQSLGDFAIYCLNQVQSHPIVTEWKLSSVTVEKIRIYHGLDQWVEAVL